MSVRRRKRIQVKRISQLNGSDVAKFAMLGVVDLPDKGHYQGLMLLNWDDRAVAAYHKGIPVGVIVYQRVEWQRCYMIKLGFVDPAFRREGIYRQLWNELVVIVEADKYEWIIGATHPGNNAMRAVMEKFARKPIRILYEYKV